MRVRSILLYLVLLIILTGLGVSMTFEALTGRRLVAHFQNNQQLASEEIEPLYSTCTNKAPIDLEAAQDPHLVKLAEYQQICESFVTDRLMVFTDMPNSSLKAIEMADKTSLLLEEFAVYQITPVMVVEPSSDWGLIDFQEYKTGFYDTWIDEYFARLKENGITDQQMGIWLPFPEANIPVWNKGNAQPADFAYVVNKYIRILKKHFPQAKITILLNSATYENDDFDWAYGEYISLLPYVEGLDRWEFSSFGLQGFPWKPQRLSQSTALLDPSQYLRHLMALEAVNSMEVKEVWFNTGTFKSKYTAQPDLEVYLTPVERKQILDEVISEARKLQERNLHVWINLFAEDKSNTAEQTDWSYWHGHNNTDLDTEVFKEFVRKLHQYNIGLSLYDKAQLDVEISSSSKAD